MEWLSVLLLVWTVLNLCIQFLSSLNLEATSHASHVVRRLVDQAWFDNNNSLKLSLHYLKTRQTEQQKIHIGSFIRHLANISTRVFVNILIGFCLFIWSFLSFFQPSIAAPSSASVTLTNNVLKENQKLQQEKERAENELATVRQNFNNQLAKQGKDDTTINTLREKNRQLEHQVSSLKSKPAISSPLLNWGPGSEPYLKMERKYLNTQTELQDLQQNTTQEKLDLERTVSNLKHKIEQEKQSSTDAISAVQADHTIKTEISEKKIQTLEQKFRILENTKTLLTTKLCTPHTKEDYEIALNYFCHLLATAQSTSTGEEVEITIPQFCEFMTASFADMYKTAANHETNVLNEVDVALADQKKQYDTDTQAILGREDADWNNLIIEHEKQRADDREEIERMQEFCVRREKDLRNMRERVFAGWGYARILEKEVAKLARDLRREMGVDEEYKAKQQEKRVQEMKKFKSDLKSEFDRGYKFGSKSAWERVAWMKRTGQPIPIVV